MNKEEKIINILKSTYYLKINFYRLKVHLQR